jgi:hypothetical protein
MKLNGVRTLIVWQVTIADRHPIKMNGLEKIYGCIGKAGVTIENKTLIFVTPVNGLLTSKQN